MVIGNHRRAIGVFARRRDAEDALAELRASGFPMHNISVVAKDSERGDNISGVDLSDRVGNEADTGAAVGAVTGTAGGMLAGLLTGLGLLAIPGLGPVIAAGTVGTTLATTLAGGGIGALSGSLIGALAGLGIPEDRARVYSNRLSAGDFMVIVDGTPDEIARAEAILLRNRGIEEWGIFDIKEDRTRNVTPL
ncbi:MAG TPA: general stress protein [Allocoleopsis sp.]